MTRSVILTTAVRYLLPLLLMFSIFALFRGHNDPGGGFVAGLLAASGFALYAIAFGVQETRDIVKAEPRLFISIGLLIAAASTLIAPIFFQQPFMTGVWGTVEYPAIGKLGTPFMFDIGVFFIVLGVTLMIIFTLFEAQEGEA